MLKKSNLLLILIILTALTLGTISIADTSDIMNINIAHGYSSIDYNTIAKELARVYPEILKYEQIGASYDGNPIYVLIMTSGMDSIQNLTDLKVTKKHYLIDGGIHARETVNPAIVLEMVENYAKDYYDDHYIQGYNINELLQNNALHFIPMLNPDGHDLSKFGLSSVQSQELVDLLATFEDENYTNWKANLRGVDINRNFPSRYIDEHTGEWISNWKKYPTENESDIPGGAYYHGEPGSELETQAFMSYVSNYDFRANLSYHSKGKVVYYGSEKYSREYNDKAETLANLINRINGYALIPDSGKGSGYSVEYFSSQTLRPSVTIETLSYKVNLPSEQNYYLSAYEETYSIALETVLLYQNEDYGDYKLYDEQGMYVRDFSKEVFAEAHAELINGKVSQYEGAPILKLMKVLTREEALIEILSHRIDLTKVTVNATDRFNDTNSLFATYAKNLKIVNGDLDGNFNPDEKVTPSEYAVICYNADNYLGLIEDHEYKKVTLKFNHPNWATNAIKYSLFNKILNERDFFIKYVLGRGFKL